jgi:hypothetical protein
MNSSSVHRRRGRAIGGMWQGGTPVWKSKPAPGLKSEHLCSVCVRGGDVLVKYSAAISGFKKKKKRKRIYFWFY